ncbi:DedA family protein, partial [bacterium]|nr:DedA family protein [bacterium]
MMSLEELLLTEGYLIYLILFVGLMGGALGLPIPEDIPLIAAGIFAERGSANVYILFLVCYSAVVIGDLIIFSMGRHFGANLFSKPWFKRSLSPRRI